ncbi:SufS family cysteine desulfurase [Sansalvadorimonas verongulae]|uniref:SufS family cysteine desulfurase n=1 Tax=Sansalvadorimonas verongulae TaxID=2172824 RepID=UPI0012BB6168|nr:SufS family cysteine desulfurase [Sansalvadorimonas verongulae]MTI15427.1 SufS family cysteine desulfurase [Sansalvadorimonas verongulae]
MTANLHLQFPILSETFHGHPLVWLDNAATTQKPQAVIDAVSQYYIRANANVHRASHMLSARATHAFEDARDTVRQFINARFTDEIIWTRGATEALNLLAHSWGRSNLKAGDEIILSAMEHHANIVPWQQIAEETGALIRVIPVTPEGELDQQVYQQLLGPKTKLVSVTHVSNALGTINPVETMIAQAKTVGATTIIDGAQAVAHFDVDMRKLGCDFYVFSGHKVYGPTGIGVLYGRRELLNDMPPWQTGGEMIEQVSFSGTTFNKPPFRFEAGTPNIAGVIGLAAAVTFLNSLDRKVIAQQEHQLRTRLEQGMERIPGIHRIGTSQNKTAVVSFLIDGFHNQDVGVLLDQQGIAVRTGHHCAMPLMEALNLPGTVRASLACYNTREDVDQILKALQTLCTQAENHEPVPHPATAQDSKALPDIFTSMPVYNPQGLTELQDTLLTKHNWQDRYRSIMQMARNLPNLPEDMRQESAKIPGCESSLWLHHHYQEDSHTLYFAAGSDAKVIRGLTVIVMSCLNGRTPDEILACDIERLFVKLELSSHLSPSRGNGLRAIVQEIQGIAQRFL